jgi:hypothetical protein
MKGILQMTRDQIIDKVRKLLALSESPNEHEAALAASKAQAFLEEHQLSMLDIKTEEGPATSAERLDIDTKSRFELWEQLLFGGLEGIFGVQCLQIQRTRGRRTIRFKRFVIGLPEDILLFKDAYQYLADTVRREGIKAWAKERKAIYGRLVEDGYPKTMIRDAVNNKSRDFYKAYRAGMASRIIERMKETKAERQQQNTKACTALVLVKDKAIDDYIQGQGWKGQIKASRSRRASLDGFAYRRGRADGGSVRLNPQSKIDRGSAAAGTIAA